MPIVKKVCDTYQTCLFFYLNAVYNTILRPSAFYTTERGLVTPMVLSQTKFDINFNVIRCSALTSYKKNISYFKTPYFSLLFALLSLFHSNNKLLDTFNFERPDTNLLLFQFQCHLKLYLNLFSTIFNEF